ncbi:MAG: hypothetical protein AAB403_04795 [Planctomycetota bacterium]
MWLRPRPWEVKGDAKSTTNEAELESSAEFQALQARFLSMDASDDSMAIARQNREKRRQEHIKILQVNTNRSLTAIIKTRQAP